MQCRLYRVGGMGRCLAVSGDHVPLCREREAHCQRGGQGCRVLAAFLVLGRPLDQATYLEVLCHHPAEPAQPHG